jgi:hypothetical protein
MHPGRGRGNKREQSLFAPAGYTGQKNERQAVTGDHAKSHEEDLIVNEYTQKRRRYDIPSHR